MMVLLANNPYHQYNFYYSQQIIINIRPSKNQLYILAMEQCVTQTAEQWAQVLAYSGRGLMRMGNYQECVLAPAMDYYQLYLSEIGVIVPLSASLCLPSVCPPDGVRDWVNQLLASQGLDIQVAAVINRIPDYEYPYDWVFYLTITLMTVLLLLVALSSALPRLAKSRWSKGFAIQNSLKVFKYNPSSRLNVLNGVKSLAMFWVIMGHQYSLGLVNVSNLLTFGDEMASWKYLLVETGILAVDVFFFVGGFLVAYSVLKQVTVSPAVKYPLAILNRLLRFLPSYIVAILIYYSIYPHLGSGPFWTENIPSLQNCAHMWRTLLFVDNLVENGSAQCLVWGWYIQNDMQIFVFSLLLLLAYGRSKKLGLGLTVLVTLGSCIFTVQQSFKYHYRNATHFTDFDQAYSKYMNDIYFKPWARCPPYLVGLFLGMLYNEFSEGEKKSKQNQPSHASFLAKLKLNFINHRWSSPALELLGVAIGSFIILIPRTAQGDREWPQAAHAFYLAFAKVFFVLGLGFIILPSLLGINSLVRFLLDTKAFNFIGKVSFWTYLIHVMVVYWQLTTIKVELYESWTPFYGLFVSTSALSMLLAFVMCLLVEIPFTKLQKELMTSLTKTIGKKGKAKQNETMEQLKQPINGSTLQKRQS